MIRLFLIHLIFLFSVRFVVNKILVLCSDLFPHPKTGINFYQHILFPGEFAVIVQQSHIRKLEFKYQKLIWFILNDQFEASCAQKEGKTPVISPDLEIARKKLD